MRVPHLIGVLALGLLLTAAASPAEAQGQLNLYCTPQEEWCRAMVDRLREGDRDQGQHDPEELR